MDTPTLLPLQLGAAGFSSPTVFTALAQSATVTLNYSPTAAGVQASIIPLDGGLINGTASARKIAVRADGSLAFAFQPPTAPGRYHVVAVVNGAETTLPFDVPAPSNTPSPAPSASPAPIHPVTN